MTPRRVGATRRQATAEAMADTPEGQELVDCPKCDGLGEIETSGFLEHGGPDMVFSLCPKCFGAEQIARWETL